MNDLGFVPASELLQYGTLEDVENAINDYYRSCGGYRHWFDGDPNPIEATIFYFSRSPQDTMLTAGDYEAIARRMQER